MELPLGHVGREKKLEITFKLRSVNCKLTKGIMGYADAQNARPWLGKTILS